MALIQHILTLTSLVLAYPLLFRGLVRLACLPLLLSGCAYDNTRSETRVDFSQINDGEVMVVGEVSIIPAVTGQVFKQETDNFKPFKKLK